MTDTPVPGLTQDDSFVPYCNESTLANGAAIEGWHFCSHLIQLEVNEVVDFLVTDVNSKFSNLSTDYSHILMSIVESKRSSS